MNPNAFFHHQLAMKMFHFQTNTYGHHKSVDKYLTKYLGNFDRFMEVYQGAHGKLSTDRIDVNFHTLNEKTVSLHLDAMIDYMSKMDLSKDLAAIRDEMVADMQQLKYLLLFK